MKQTPAQVRQTTQKLNSLKRSFRELHVQVQRNLRHQYEKGLRQLSK
jgi:hypothetical protein